MWTQGIYEGYRYQAKVYDTGSKHGINHGRISKLSIWDGEIEIYNYDRGLDFCNAPENIVTGILTKLKNNEGGPND